MLGMNAHATDYFVSASGNDGSAGTSTLTAWKTITKINSVWAAGTFAPGDRILFNRGDVFYGKLIAGESGTAGSPITVGAYGSGAQPVISGFTTVSVWTSLSGNIWESTTAVSTLATCNMVTINGTNTAMGRYPTTGYLSYESFSGNTSITDNQLTTSPYNWTGAEVVIKVHRYNIKRGVITNHSGGTLTYSGLGNNGQNNWGYFIQNDVRTLTYQNAWYYNPTSKRIRIYSTTSPVNVKVATVDTLVYIGKYSYITLDNLSIQGANLFGVKSVDQNVSPFIDAKYLTIQNCSFDFSGRSAIECYPGVQGLITFNNTINHSNDAGINAGSSAPATHTYNTVKNTGVFPGMGNPLISTFRGIHDYGKSVIMYNTVDTTGYNGISTDGDSSVVEYNKVDYFGFVTDDGGGIYSYPSQPGAVHTTRRKIAHNIVLNGIGNNEGAGGTLPANQAMGIYLDGASYDFNVVGNSVSSCQDGILINNNHETSLDSNTFYNNAYQIDWENYDPATAMTGVTINKNISVARTSTQLAFIGRFQSPGTMPASYRADNNYYARPIDDNLVFNTATIGSGIICTRNLTTTSGTCTGGGTASSWKTFSTHDSNSLKSPLAIADVNDLRFEYNATASPDTRSLGGFNYRDVRNVNYPGTITLQPWTSAVLIKTTAANTAPTANAGTDQAIQLPTNSVSLSGSGTDTDGSIVSYAWVKISGGAATITSASSAATTVTGLVAGVYQFRLTVTDNGGATATDNMQVTVNPANVAPAANAGSDQAITLPVSTVTLSGSGSDPDGSVVSYLWTKTAGGAGTITSASSASTSVTGLVAGTYTFHLVVTDNQGSTGADDMQVVVSVSPNIAPTAAAGADQAIQLPVSQVSLTGGGTDPDGTISSYAWTKVSVPVGDVSVITSASSASTTITSMTVAGTYQFKLTVTDNGGLTGTDNIIIVVSPANVQPIANAGTNQSITLPTSSVTLSGSASDPDGSVSSHSWTKISGTGGTITSASSYSTSVTGLSAGTYVFRLTATDNQGLTGFDEMTVTVNPALNISPTASAGGNKIITLPTSTVTQVGSGSDPDGTISSYLWTKTSGPATFNIVSPTSATTVINSLTTAGTYVFTLTVTDNSGATGSATATITVNAAPNQSPTSNAGADQAITLPTNSVTISGSGTDPDGTVSSYLWVKVSGPAAGGGAITSSGSASTTVTGMFQGTYVYSLTVTDNQGATATDQMQIVVNPAPVNQPPTASAGIDQTITLPTSSITLSGSGTDADGTISGYLWTKVSGPASGTITTPSSASTSVTGLAAGTYVFQLRVTDNQSAIATDQMQVIVNAAPVNISPTANAGADQSIQLPVNSVTLTGSGADADGTVAGYLWTKVSGPSCTIGSAPFASTSVTNMNTAGIYIFQLRVTDNQGATATDQMQVVVNPAFVGAPTVNAGVDQLVPPTSTTLTATGTPYSGHTITYLWSKISGSGGTITTPASASTTITGLSSGVYVYRVIVTQDDIQSAQDDIQITVDIPPVADPGGNLSINYPGIPTLSGSGSSDADGTVAAYLWTQTSGASSTITTPTAVSTTITGMNTTGAYTYRLRVTDNLGLTHFSFVTVTVDPASPTVNAGVDISIPPSSITITATATTASGHTATYQWTKLSGSGGVIVSPTALSTSITGLSVGGYSFRITGTQDDGQVVSDTIAVTVVAGNVSPVSNAGSDLAVSQPGNTTTITGSGTDIDGTVASYLWVQVSGPPSTVVSPASATTNISYMNTVGVYVYSLTVTDNQGATSTDQVQITVSGSGQGTNNLWIFKRGKYFK